MRVVVFDLETGGVDTYRSPIIQIGAVVLDTNALAIVDEPFECKVQFERGPDTEKALAMNSYDEAAWAAQAVPKAKAMERFAAFLEPYRTVCMESKKTHRQYYVARLMGYNAAAFDGPMLFRDARSVGVFMPADLRIVDVMQRAAWDSMCATEPNFSMRLKDVATRLLGEAAVASVELHDAVGDATLTAMVAIQIMTEDLV